MFSVMLTSKLHRVRMRWRNTMELSMISPLSPNLFLMKAAADPIIFSDRLLVQVTIIYTDIMEKTKCLLTCTARTVSAKCLALRLSSLILSWTESGLKISLAPIPPGAG